MMAISGSIKKYPISLMKDDIVFIEGDTNDSWEKYKNVPLFYNGVHATTGQMMFETPNDGTIYLAAPIIGCIIPKAYKEHIYDEVDDFLDNLPEEVDEFEPQVDDIEVHRARRQEGDATAASVFRAAAEDLESGDFGAEPDGAIVVIVQGNTCQYRPVGLTTSQLTQAFEWCKLNNMGVAFYDEQGIEDE